MVSFSAISGGLTSSVNVSQTPFIAAVAGLSDEKKIHSSSSVNKIKNISSFEARVNSIGSSNYSVKSQGGGTLHTLLAKTGLSAFSPTITIGETQ